MTRFWREAAARQQNPHPPSLSAGKFRALQPLWPCGSSSSSGVPVPGAKLPAPAVLPHCRLMARLDFKEKKKINK